MIKTSTMIIFTVLYILFRAKISPSNALFDRNMTKLCYILLPSLRHLFKMYIWIMSRSSWSALIEQQIQRQNLNKVQHQEKTFLLAAQCSFSVDNNWNKVFRNGPSKLCGRQHSKNLKGCSLLKDELRRTFANGKHVADPF